MSFVEIYKLQNNGEQKLIVTCKLIGETVVCEGDETLINNFENDGILDYSSNDQNKKLFLKDGLKFLEQLKYNFKSGYFNASGVKEK